MMKQQHIDWSVPQRQPIAGLFIAFIKTLWEVLKRIWPFFLILLFKGKQDKGDRYEIIAAAFAFFTIAGSIIKFLYFRFCIINNELVINKGWLKKETITVPLQKIQTVNIEQSLLHSALGVVKVSIDTAGSTKTEASIDALHKPMAEALRNQLENRRETDVPIDVQTKNTIPVLSLTGKDLIRLSISANHIEAFFILASFFIGILDNLRRINLNLPGESLMPNRSILIFLFLAMSVLVFTVLVSTIRIFLKFYDLQVHETPTGYYIRSGLTNVKERIVAFSKIQFISWKASWIRKKMNLWLLEYHISGADESKGKTKVQIPVTQKHQIPLLNQKYYSLPVIEHSATAVTIHRSYVIRRFLLRGLIPAVIVIAITWVWWQNKSLLFLLYPLLIGISSWLFQKKFKLYALQDILYNIKGFLGEEKIILQWYKIQSVTLKQSIFQRKKNLATVILHTAGGSVVLPFISLQAAQQIVNYGLFEIERTDRSWM
ncbi:MAG: PH domain-containing protein [Chitinophagaceae bacterium]